MFYTTNTQTKINLNNCKFTYGSGIFLNASQNNGWGTLGENGADVILNLVNQNIEGDILVDDRSELEIKMVNSTIKGSINNAKKASELKISLDSDSSIILTNDSFYTSINNEDKSGKNIINGSYSISSYESINKISNYSSKLSLSYFIVFMILILIL